MKVVFVASMLWEYGLGYALMPFAYLVLGKAIQEKFAPMDWNLFVKSETHKAKFRTSWTRVVTHSEAISALGGGQTERGAVHIVQEARPAGGVGSSEGGGLL